MSYTLLFISHFTGPVWDSRRTVATRRAFSLLVEFLKASAPTKGEEGKVRRVIQESDDCFLTRTVCSPAHKWKQGAGLSLEKS